jgi:MazG family protein
MARLRDPARGCPWDVTQTFATIAPYTIEEAYEVADAIDRGDMSDLRDELGDLLLQIVFHARMAEEAGVFDLDDVGHGITDKMIDRHPHVFGSDPATDGAEVERGWEQRKALERDRRAAATGGPAGTLDGVSLALPALTRAEKLQKRASRVGFDWAAPEPVLAKIDEELDELRREMAAAAPADRMLDEVGDVLFAVANLARHLGIDPEAALRHTNAKFERRFRAVEARLAAEGTTPAAAGLDRMEALWGEIKRDEHAEHDTNGR